jgi:hypothetical protein
LAGVHVVHCTGLNLTPEVSELLKPEPPFPFTPQLMRKIATTTLAVHNPKEVHAIQGILGHAGLAVGERYYNLANSISAFEQLDGTIDRVARDSKTRKFRQHK